MKISIVVLISIFLCACAAPIYKAPHSDQTSKVRLRMDGEGYTVYAATYMTENCKNGHRLGYLGVADGIESRNIGMIGSAGKNDIYRIEQIFAANKPLYLVFQAYGPVGTAGAALSISMCNLTISFTPSAKSQYELTHRWNESGCQVSVDELHMDSSNNIEVKPVKDTKKEDWCW